MTLYYGQRDSSDKMNWKQAGQKFEKSKLKQYAPTEHHAVIVSGVGRFRDTSKVAMKNISQNEFKKVQQEAKVNDKVYNPVAINQVGWINCDRLFKPDALRTNIQFAILNKVEEVNYANVYLIFKDIKSVMQSPYYIYENKIEGANFNNIPVGMTVKFLAVCYQHEKLFATLTDTMKVKVNQTEKLTLQEMNESDFDKLLKNLE